MNPMQDLRIQKIVVHMGVGESGEKLSRAEDVLTTITAQKPVKALAKKTQPAFGTRKGSPIGCKVTLRGDAAESFFATSFGIVERQIAASQFDAAQRRGGSPSEIGFLAVPEVKALEELLRTAMEARPRG